MRNAEFANSAIRTPNSALGTFDLFHLRFNERAALLKTELCDKILSLVPRFSPGFDLGVRF